MVDGTADDGTAAAVSGRCRGFAVVHVLGKNYGIKSFEEYIWKLVDSKWFQLVGRRVSDSECFQRWKGFAVGVNVTQTRRRPHLEDET